MSFINIADLTFAYEGSYDNIFERVSFRMDTDWKLGFTGRNGRGKTTFLRLLMDTNETAPKYEYEGSITADILYRPFSTLSHGERTKVLLALLFLRENSFLLIDEPTNHLDIQAREILGEYLKKKSGFILVSHDRRLLDTCVDHILAINKTNIEIQKGNFSSWWENKKRQDEFELAQDEKLRKDISRLKTAAKQSKDWADKVEATKIGHKSAEKFATVKSIDTRAYIGEKSRRMQMRRKNLEKRQEKAIDEKSGLLKNLEENSQLKLFPLEYRALRLAVFENVSVSYGENYVFTGLNMEICRGDRIVLSGKNGCGKSSLMKLFLELWEEKAQETLQTLQISQTQEMMRYSGQIQIGSGLIISYVPQDTGFLNGSLQDYARRCEVDLQLFLTLLRKLDLSRTQLEKPMESFSEGQKKKVLLAASLATRAHLYIWDEPLNYIDVFSRMQMEELILAYHPTLLFVEHDREFTERIGTKEIQFSVAL